MASIFSSNGKMVYQVEGEIRVEIEAGKAARVYGWSGKGWTKMLNKSWQKIVDRVKKEVAR